MAPMPDTISESPAEFEGGATVTKNVVFKGTGIKKCNPNNAFDALKVLTAKPMVVMCGVCGDVGPTVLVDAGMSCFKNWCCLPFPGCFCIGCHGLK